MKQQLTTRLDELKSQFEKGQEQLAELDKNRRELEKTVLRISGAIQVIEELLAEQTAERLDTAEA